MSDQELTALAKKAYQVFTQALGHRNAVAWEELSGPAQAAWFKTVCKVAVEYEIHGLED